MKLCRGKNSCGELKPFHEFYEYYHFCRKCNNNRRQRYPRKKYDPNTDGVYSRSPAGRKSYNRWLKSKKGKKYLKKRRLSNCITAGMHRSLKGNKEGLHWESLVNYSLENLKEHLEKQFKSGMNWENHGKGKGKWHIDHIKPISSFNITSYKCNDFKQCWSLNNLRPLWSHENQSRKRR